MQIKKFSSGVCILPQASRRSGRWWHDHDNGEDDGEAADERIISDTGVVVQLAELRGMRSRGAAGSQQQQWTHAELVAWQQLEVRLENPPGAPAADPSRPPTVHALEARIGSGSTGQVWSTRLPGSGQLVAAKVFYRLSAHRDKLARHATEVRVAMRLHHECVCATLGTAIVADPRNGQQLLALLMELVEGGTLEHLITHHSTRHSRPPARPADDQGAEQLLSIDLKIRLAGELASAVAYLHRNDVLHCDIKPRNVLLTAGEPMHVKLCDFGVASSLSIEQHAQRFGVCGTPRYMAPHVAFLPPFLPPWACLPISPHVVPRGRYMAPEVAFRAYGFPADVYSFGVCFYELLHETRFLADEHTALDILLVVTRNGRPQARLGPAMLADLDAHGVLQAGVAADTIEQCWQQAWEKRPAMAEVALCLGSARESGSQV